MEVELVAEDAKRVKIFSTSVTCCTILSDSIGEHANKNLSLDLSTSDNNNQYQEHKGQKGLSSFCFLFLQPCLGHPIPFLPSYSCLEQLSGMVMDVGRTMAF